MRARTLSVQKSFEWRDFEENFRWVLKLVCLHVVVIVILKPELRYYFMSVQVSLEKVGFSLFCYFGEFVCVCM